jgi:hypothetical protein
VDSRARALAFDWDQVAREFVNHLAPIRGPRVGSVDVVLPGLV